MYCSAGTALQNILLYQTLLHRKRVVLLAILWPGCYPVVKDEMIQTIANMECAYV